MMRKGTVIENEVAYNAAKEARIRANAAKTRTKNYFQKWGAEAEFVHNFFFGVDEYEDHPARNGMFANNFLHSMYESYNNWGSLTDRQHELTVKSFKERIARHEARVADREAKRELDAARSSHIGSVGERVDIEITVERVIRIESDYSDAYFINLCRDLAGNVVVYKGNRWECGNATIRTTIKAHAERDGVKQTIVNRPKLLSASWN